MDCARDESILLPNVDGDDDDDDDASDCIQLRADEKLFMSEDGLATDDE